MQKQLRLCFQVRSIISVFRAYEERHFFLAVEVNWWTVKRFHVQKVLFLKVKFWGLYCAEWSVSVFVLLMELIEFRRDRSHVWALSWKILWFTEITQSLIFRTCVNLYTKKVNQRKLTYIQFVLPYQILWNFQPQPCLRRAQSAMDLSWKIALVLSPPLSITLFG